LGLVVVFCVLIFVGIGVFVDIYFKLNNIGTILGAVIGIVVGVIIALNSMKKFYKD